MRAVLILGTLSVCVGGSFGTPSVAESQTRTNWAELWLTQPEYVRTWYVGGFEGGLYAGSTLLWRLSGKLDRLRDIEDAIPLMSTSEADRAALERVSDLWLDLHDPNPFGNEVVAQVISQFYQDAANSMIPPAHLVPVAILRLRGAEAPEVSERLRLLREVAAAVGR